MKKSGKILLLTIASTAVVSLLILVIFAVISPQTKRLRLDSSGKGTYAVHKFDAPVKTIDIESVGYGNLKINVKCDGHNGYMIDGQYDKVFSHSITDGVLKISIDGEFEEYLECEMTIFLANPVDSIRSLGSGELYISKLFTPQLDISTENGVTFDDCDISRLDITYRSNSWEDMNLTVNHSKFENVNISSGSDMTLRNRGNIGLVSFSPRSDKDVILDIDGLTSPDVKLIPTEKAKAGVLFSKPTLIPFKSTPVTIEE